MNVQAQDSARQYMNGKSVLCTLPGGLICNTASTYWRLYLRQLFLGLGFTTHTGSYRIKPYHQIVIKIVYLRIKSYHANSHRPVFSPELDAAHAGIEPTRPL